MRWHWVRRRLQKDQAASAADQTAAEEDQTASDTDQTASDRDQLQAEADQRASERDQAASDRDAALRAPRDLEMRRDAAMLRRLGVDATDVIGGFQAWREAGLPVASTAN